MQLLDFREQGFCDLACDCGRRFVNTEKAVKHVVRVHCSEEQKSNVTLTRDVIARVLSPNPISPEAYKNAAQQER